MVTTKSLDLIFSYLTLSVTTNNIYRNKREIMHAALQIRKVEGKKLPSGRQSSMANPTAFF